MPPENKNNIQAVLTYLSSLWGLASGVSVLFPLSNQLVQALPNDIFVEVQPRTALTPALLTTFATILSLFAILLIVSWRREIARATSFDITVNNLRKVAIVAFVVAVFCLLIYTSIAEAYRRNYATTAVSERATAEYVGFFGYPLVFASFTTAFTALGLREYLLEQRESDS